MEATFVVFHGRPRSYYLFWKKPSSVRFYCISGTTIGSRDSKGPERGYPGPAVHRTGTIAVTKPAMAGFWSVSSPKLHCSSIDRPHDPRKAAHSRSRTEVARQWH